MKLNINDILNIIQNFINDNIISIIMAILLIIVSTITTYIKMKNKKQNKVNNIKNNDSVLSNNNIQNKDTYQIKAFNLIKELKTAKMNLDIDKIKNITTNNIYELYKTQIETLKNKQQKNIVDKIKYIKSYITDITDDNIINLRVIIECYDYIIDKNNKIIKGKYNKKMLQTYEIEIIDNDPNYIIQKIELLYEREI